MKIRFAKASDATELAELFRQLGYPSTSEILAQRLEERFENRDAEVFVAVGDEKILGAAVVNCIRPLHEPGIWAVLSALVVDEAARGQGVGAALLEHTEKHVVAMGCTHIELSSNENRTRAHEFYIHHGFTEVRKRFVRRFA